MICKNIDDSCIKHHQTVSNNMKQHETTSSHLFPGDPSGASAGVVSIKAVSGASAYMKRTQGLYLNDSKWQTRKMQNRIKMFQDCWMFFWQLSMTLSWARCDFSSPVEPCERCRTLPHGAIMGYPRAPHVHQMVSTCFKDIMSYQIIYNLKHIKMFQRTFIDDLASS